MKNISKGNYLSLYITLPPLEEQNQIAFELKIKLESVDNIKNENEDAIEKLKEYRQALISEAVIGKIMV